MTMQTREQRIVAAIADAPDLPWEKMESRAESLPAMLLRHGVLPVKLFFETKQDEDRALWQLVERAMRNVLPEVGFGLNELAAMNFETYLLVNDVATEAASLAARWVKVQTADLKRRATLAAEPQKEGTP